MADTFEDLEAEALGWNEEDEKQLRAQLATANDRIVELEDDLVINKNAYGVWHKRCLKVEADLAAFQGSHRDLVACVIDMAADIAELEAECEAFANTEGMCTALQDARIVEQRARIAALEGALRPLLEYDAIGDRLTPHHFEMWIQERLGELAALLRGDGEEGRDETDT